MRTIPFTAPSGVYLAFTELGFGTAPLGNLYRALSEEAAQSALEAAWTAGLRYFDTAPLYGLGLAETRLNHFFRGKPRDQYIVSTKVGRRLVPCAPETRTGIGKFFDTPARHELYDYTHDGILRSFEDSLERLGLDSVEILFVHDIDIANHKSAAARDAHISTLMGSGYRALERLRSEKVIKAFGAGVNEWQACEILAEAGDFDLFLLAGRYTLLEQEALASFLPLAQTRGIGIVIGGAYNSGILASGPKPGAFYNYEVAPPAILERVARLETVCARHDIKLVEAALRFPLMHPAVVSVIPGAVSPEEVARNMTTLGKDIPPALWADLKSEGLIHADAPVDEV
ncbi:MAG: aldo/keto reductase [Hyphomicrobiaceae bacterium]